MERKGFFIYKQGQGTQAGSPGRKPNTLPSLAPFALKACCVPWSLPIPFWSRYGNNSILHPLHRL